MPEEDADMNDRLNRLYLTIISRYKDYIEEKEGISIAELPSLVTPKSPAIVSKAEEIKLSFGNYEYDKCFYEASLKAFSFVKQMVREVTLPVEFWLLPEETIAFLMGDTFDRNVLLCSILIALGNPSARVLVVSQNDSRKVYVHYDFNESSYLMNLEDRTRRFADIKELVASLDMPEGAIAYDFNDKTYTDIG